MVPDSTDCKVTEDQGLRQGYYNEYYILNTIRFRPVKEAFYRHRCLQYSLTLQSRLDRTFFVIHRIEQQGWKHSRPSHQGFRPQLFPPVLISFPETLLLFYQIIYTLSNHNARFTFFKSHVIIQFVPI